MKNRFVLAALTAITLVTLSACGSTVQGAAVGGVAGQTNGAPTAPSDITSGDESAPGTGDDTSAPDTSTEDTTGPETSDGTSTDETTPSEDTSTDETTRGSSGSDVDLDKCKAVTDFATAFANMLTKIQSGPISQSDVDAVFTDDVQAALPEAAQANYEKLKDLSNRLVGKSLSELGDVATELQSAATDLQTIIKSACGVG